jgi:hypothetical protein
MCAIEWSKITAASEIPIHFVSCTKMTWNSAMKSAFVLPDLQEPCREFEDDQLQFILIELSRLANLETEQKYQNIF